MPFVSISRTPGCTRRRCRCHRSPRSVRPHYLCDHRCRFRGYTLRGGTDMRRSGSSEALTALIFLPFVATLFAQRGETPPPGTPASGDDPIKALVGRLDVERYKATI